MDVLILLKRTLCSSFKDLSNQRIIDVKKSLDQGKVVIWDKLNDGQKNYEQVDRKDMI